MGLFTDIGEGIAAVTGAVSDAVSDYQRNRRKTKALKYEKQLADDLIKQNAKTAAGISTGDNPYSSAADTASAIGEIAGPVSEAVTESLSAYFGSKAITGAAASVGDAISNAAGALTGGGSTAANNVRTPIGDVNVTTAALVAGAVVVALVLTREGGR